jgi:hypothetical protein
MEQYDEAGMRFLTLGIAITCLRFSGLKDGGIEKTW